MNFLYHSHNLHRFTADAITILGDDCRLIVIAQADLFDKVVLYLCVVG